MLIRAKEETIKTKEDTIKTKDETIKTKDALVAMQSERLVDVKKQLSNSNTELLRVTGEPWT